MSEPVDVTLLSDDIMGGSGGSGCASGISAPTMREAIEVPMSHALFEASCWLSMHYPKGSMEHLYSEVCWQAGQIIEELESEVAELRSSAPPPRGSEVADEAAT